MLRRGLRQRLVPPPAVPLPPAAAPGAVEVLLRRMNPQRKIAAIKELRMATGGGLKWAKSIADRVEAGETMSVWCRPAGEDPVAELPSWTAELAAPAGSQVVRVRVPENELDALRAFVDERGGSVL